jgi:hypothetical protein
MQDLPPQIADLLIEVTDGKLKRLGDCTLGDVASARRFASERGIDLEAEIVNRLDDDGKRAAAVMGVEQEIRRLKEVDDDVRQRALEDLE